eukprot:Nitzschia sp. Nitz4//scaffold131_size63436//25536//27848//NITZ4_006272-RA/size63436-processed-gene-0.116-mRNA-1//-1//CDS//3329535259//6006//frame0
MEASMEGCKVIRNFQQGGVIGGTLKLGGDIKSVVTQADIDAQARIVGGLRLAWGDDLKIIGEEDENEAKPNFEGGAFRKDILTDSGLLDEQIPLEDLALFVDPLDGTREFVEGRLQNVGCLIGIARKCRPIAGVIGVPFPGGSVDEPPRIHYAIADQLGSAGSWPIPAYKRTDVVSSSGLTILTGDSKDQGLKNATEFAKSMVAGSTHQVVGGTAAKLGIVATHPNTIAILHPKTELWDTCAPQSLMESQGGKVTDLFGAPLDHDPNRPFGNIFGVVASSGEPAVAALHDKICAHMRTSTEYVRTIFKKWMGEQDLSVPQAMDIARDLNGIPFSVEQIEQIALEGQNIGEAKLKSYSVPESSAWRGLMSNGCRYYLDWEEKGDHRNLPASLFYKRVVMADLSHARDKLKTAPHKLVRDVKSYQVENLFLTGDACKAFVADTGIRISRVHGGDLRPVPEDSRPKDQLDGRFSAFLEDFDTSNGWSQQWLLDECGAKAALRTLAKLHAYFWTGSKFWSQENGRIAAELETSVWENGGYMQPKLQGYDQLSKVSSGWSGRYPTFRESLESIPELKGANLEKLGERLEKVAAEVGDKAHPFVSSPAAFKKYRTLIHGDPKQANIFFRNRAGDDLFEVGLIDFQWSGFGLAATDVAHFLCAAVSPTCVSYDGSKEQTLLDFFYQSLSEGLVECGVAQTTDQVKDEIFPRQVFDEQLETAILDICRMVFAYAWRRWKAEPEPSPESFNRNAYNKSLDSALWLVVKCHMLLEKYDAK